MIFYSIVLNDSDSISACTCELVRPSGLGSIEQLQALTIEKLVGERHDEKAQTMIAKRNEVDKNYDKAAPVGFVERFEKKAGHGYGERHDDEQEGHDQYGDVHAVVLGSFVLVRAVVGHY